MNQTEAKIHALERVTPERLYSPTILRIARHFWRTREAVLVLELADDLQKRPEVVVIGVVNETGRYVGIVRRDSLFALIGKPFGREVLRRSVVKEVMENPASFHANADVFVVAQQLRALESQRSEIDETRENVEAAEKESWSDFFPLVDDDRRLQGILAAQDLANHLARITQDDIELAGRLQLRLLSGTELPRGSGYRLAAWSRAATGVGGDFYFAREIAGGRIFATLCDVSGKGVAASLIVSVVWGILRGYDFRRPLRELLTSLNQAIVATFHLEKYLTGVFMIYDTQSKKLVYADMGHSHMMLLRDGRALALRSARMNLPIGIEHEIEPIVHAVRLKGGEALFIYSDGIVEQENTEGVEFGERGLARALLGRDRGADVGRREEGITAIIDTFRGGTPQQDDMSFLLLEVETGAEEKKT